MKTRPGTAMTVQLARVPLDLPDRDAGALRAWAQRRVFEEVCCNPGAPAQILVPHADHADRLDWEAAAREQPQANLGATFRHLAGLAPDRIFLVFSAVGEDAEGEPANLAILLEEGRSADGARRRWWVATLRFDLDPTSGLGRPAADWETSDGETDDPSRLPPFLREIISPPPGAKPAKFLAPGLTSVDIRMTFDALPDGVEPPSDVVGVIHLARALCERSLLDKTIAGLVVLKLFGRNWELYQLRGAMPGDPVTMIRYLANVIEPVADAMAVVSIAVGSDRGPGPGVQIVAQQGGQISETWMPLAFPDGPKGLPVPGGEMMLRTPSDVAEQDRWIGVVPTVEWTLPMLGVGEA